MASGSIGPDAIYLSGAFTIWDKNRLYFKRREPCYRFPTVYNTWLSINRKI